MQKMENNRIDIVVTDAGQLPGLLDEAEEALGPIAKSRKAGILVTRHEVSWFSLVAHRDVPYGANPRAFTHLRAPSGARAPAEWGTKPVL